MTMPGVKKPAIALCFLILLFAVVVFYYLNKTGQRARVYKRPYEISGPVQQAHMVRTSTELYAYYRQSGLRGRVIINAGRFLHFLVIGNDMILQGNDHFPLRLFDVRPAFEDAVDLKNYLWVAVRTGLARELHYLVPARTFLEKKEAAVRDNTDIISVNEHEIRAHYWGSRRTISDRLPNLGEAVVLNVDASFFDLAEPEALVNYLRGSGLLVDVLTLNLSEDNPEVSAEGREKLRNFAALLAGGALHGR